MMLRGLSSLRGCAVVASGVEAARIEDVYFDDELWMVRYLVATDSRFAHAVLIFPITVTGIDWRNRRLAVGLPADAISNAPAAALAQPESERHSRAYPDVYRWPRGWPGGGVWGIPAYPVGAPGWSQAEEPRSPDEGHSHL